jgi:hypothetical protein
MASSEDNPTFAETTYGDSTPRDDVAALVHQGAVTVEEAIGLMEQNMAAESTRLRAEMAAMRAEIAAGGEVILTSHDPLFVFWSSCASVRVIKYTVDQCTRTTLDCPCRMPCSPS